MQSWWEDQKTQTARINFCDKYVKKNIDFEFLIQKLRNKKNYFTNKYVSINVQIMNKINNKDTQKILKF